MKVAAAVSLQRAGGVGFDKLGKTDMTARLLKVTGLCMMQAGVCSTCTAVPCKQAPALCTRTHDMHKDIDNNYRHMEGI